MRASLRNGLIGIAVALAGGAMAWTMLTQDAGGPPEGFVQGNGRLEAEQIDICIKAAVQACDPRNALRMNRLASVAQDSVAHLMRDAFERECG